MQFTNRKEGVVDILENALVKEYFTCEIEECLGNVLGEPKHRSGIDCRKLTSEKVLRAMEEKIQKGDHVLQMAGDNVYDTSAQFDMDNSFHSRRNFLRIPSKFQEARKYEMPICISDSYCTWKYKLKHAGDKSIKEVYEVVRDFLKSDDVEGELIRPSPELNIKPSTTVTPAPEKCGCNEMQARTHPGHCDIRDKPADSGKCECLKTEHWLSPCAMRL